MTTTSEDEPLVLLGGGLVCPVGTDVATGIAAIVARVSRLRTVVDPSVQSAPFVIAPARLRGAALAESCLPGMLADAVAELAAGPCPTSLDGVAAFIGWPDPARPGAPARPTAAEVVDLLGSRSGGRIVPRRVQCITGETAGARALAWAARELRSDPTLEACLVAAADSWLSPDALRWVADRCRLCRHVSDEGFAPAEAAAAVWLTRARCADARVGVLGIGMSTATVSQHGSSGLPIAIGHALALGGRDLAAVDHLVFDSGTDPWKPLYRGLTQSRVLGAPWRGPTWIPAMSIGHVGAAAGLVAVLLARHLLVRHEHGGTALCVIGSGYGHELAIVLGAPQGASASQEEEIPWAL